MAAKLPVFTQEEMVIDEALGFPRAYALLCRSSATINPFTHGPPLSFIPYALQSQEAFRVKELNQMFPIIDPEACSSANLGSYINFLWEELDHLGNAGFEPALFRVDCFGNVVYLHADPASPLAWDIDHWFPCSRGGKTVPSNLRILQWQVCRKKKNKLDFLIPWWDLQLGISVNQFLSIFASKNSDFRSRAFSFFFPDERGEELNCLQNLRLHSFPQKFMDAKRKLGLAPAAIVSSQNISETMVLKAVDLNRSLRHNSPFPAAMKSLHKEEDTADQAHQRFRSSISKENNQSAAIDDCKNNPYLTISCARDSLRQRKEARKQQAEICQLGEELNELKQKNDIERIALQELEAVLIGRRRRVEKCRRLSEAQASYRSLLEKMIRDAMHQNVVYKEQLRLNQAASSALMARLEAQRAACDSSENELRRKYKQRDELEEIQAKACSEQARKRSRIYDDLHEHSNRLSSTRRVRRPTKKELRVFLEEEHKASEAGISLSFEEEEEWEEEEAEETASIVNEEEDHCQTSTANTIKNAKPLNSKLKGFAIEEESYNVEEGNDTILVSKDQELTVNNKLKQIQHNEFNVIKTSESCKRINDQKKQTSYHCDSSCNVEEGHDEILVNNKIEQVQKRGLDIIKTNESQRQWNLHLSSHEQQEENDQYRYRGLDVIKTNESMKQWNLHLSSHEQEEENDEYRNRVGKGNVEKWLQILLENAKEGSSYPDSPPTPRNFDEATNNSNNGIKQNEIELSTINHTREKHCSGKMDSEKRFKEKSRVGTSSSAWKVASRSRKSFEVGERAGLPKCESSRGISFPSSPSVILGMRKSVDCMRRKPRVIGDDDNANENCISTNSNMINSSISKTTKK